jgi:hypothetical protein
MEDFCFAVLGLEHGIQQKTLIYRYVESTEINGRRKKIVT